MENTKFDNPTCDWDQFAKDELAPAETLAQRDERLADELYWARLEDQREWESEIEMARRQR